MATEADIVARVRRELGDLGESFQSSAIGDGETSRFNLPAGLIEESTVVVSVIPPGGDVVTLTGWTLTGNTLVTSTPIADGSTLIVQGRAYAMFTDAELLQYVRDALLQHTTGRSTTYRFRDAHGFIEYDDVEMTVEGLPGVEEYPVGLLATIFALWTLATDAATDIDVYSGEGTTIPRHQRFQQVRSQIAELQERYNDIASALNVGLHRIEVSTLRRVSRTTNRYVPIWVAREYDDHRFPQRVLPPIDKKNLDESGLPSPNYGNEPW